MISILIKRFILVKLLIVILNLKTKAASFTIKGKKRRVKRINAIGDDARRRSPRLEAKRNKLN